ncbi:MAG: FGGY-family carbohydrate kinase [Rhodospirillales bacterium]
MAVVLAIDLGGSALKACLFDPAGEVLARATVPLTFEEDADGRSEQDPDLWWQALLSAGGEIAARAPEAFAKVAAVTVCGFTRTQVLLDDGGQVLRPAMAFRDSRAAQAAADALARPDVAAHPQARNLNAYHPLARLLWLQRHEPEVWAAVRLLLEPKDYLNLRLTGQASSDPISQHWLSMALEGGAASLAQAAGLDRDPLPPIVAPAQSVGHVLPDLPQALAGLAGAQVFCGSNDTWAAAAGLGALRAGRAYCISGSSEVLGLMADRTATAEGLITLPWGPDLWHLGGPGLNGANTLNWIVDLLDPRPLPFARRLDELLQAPRSGQPLLFHPYLRGERTPFWDRDLRASFLGLDAGHGPGDLVRAVMEGVGFLNRTVLERAERASGQTALDVRIAGGGSRSSAWNQTRANCLGRTLLAAPEAEMGLRGCLALARVGLGLATDLGSAAGELLEIRPEPGARPRFDALFALFTETQASLSDASHRLAAVAAAEGVS